MSRNGSGTYTLPAGNPVVTGTTITSSWANATLSNIADALTQSVSADGQTPITGAINMTGHLINNVTDPTSAQDAATKAYVDLTQTASGITGGTITGATLTNDTIDNSPIGSITRSTVKATTLDLGLSTQSVAIGQGNASIMKNRIINGAMVIDQRYAGVAQSLSSVYTVDRFIYAASQSTKFVFGQNLNSVTTPAGFTKYLGFGSASAYSILTGDYFAVGQPIEGFNTADLGWGTANAKTVTLSFQVYSSLTGTFGGVVKNGGSTRSYPFTYSVPVANTWTTISVTIAGDTTGTWATDNTTGIAVYWGLGVGSTYSGTAGSWASANYISATGATSVVGTSGATFYITGVQLEVGSSATGFEYRQYGQELALCQRYYQKSYNVETVPATATTVGCMGNNSNSYSGGIWFPIRFPTSMRTSPSITTYSTFSGASGNYAINNASDSAITGTASFGANGFSVYGAAAGNYGGYVQWVVTAEL